MQISSVWSGKVTWFPHTHASCFNCLPPPPSPKSLPPSLSVAVRYHMFDEHYPPKLLSITWHRYYRSSMNTKWGSFDFKKTKQNKIAGVDRDPWRPSSRVTSRNPTTPCSSSPRSTPIKSTGNTTAKIPRSNSSLRKLTSIFLPPLLVSIDTCIYHSFPFVRIGLHISTKAVGQFAREDITHLYKHEDSELLPLTFNRIRIQFWYSPVADSTLERESVLRALRQSESMFSRYYLNESLEDVKFDFKLVDDIIIGSSFKYGQIYSFELN